MRLSDDRMSVAEGRLQAQVGTLQAQVATLQAQLDQEMSKRWVWTCTLASRTCYMLDAGLGV
jgi:hypothetical protein